MPILAREDDGAQTEPQRNRYRVICDRCEVVYDAGPYFPGTVADEEALDKAEQMKAFHVENKRGHRVTLYLDSTAILISTGVFADEAVRG